MLKRLTALVFILIVAGGALAGTPLHACAPECDMGGTSGMDVMECCRKSHRGAQVTAQESPTSESCCARGSQPAPATTTSAVAQRLPRYNPVQQLPAALPSPGSTPEATSALYTVYLPPSTSQPAYILHLALLI